MKISLYSVGKTKESWLEEALAEYSKRLTGRVEIYYTFAKNDAQLLSQIEKESRVICLDPAAKGLTSEAFSHFLFQNLEEGGSRLAFVIGGPVGLPKGCRTRYPLISLSPLTFTHQIARLILVEQIYRAFEIAKGSSYHK